jgi:hypothetical protein
VVGERRSAISVAAAALNRSPHRPLDGRAQHPSQLGLRPLPSRQPRREPLRAVFPAA